MFSVPSQCCVPKSWSRDKTMTERLGLMSVMMVTLAFTGLFCLREVFPHLFSPLTWVFTCRHSSLFIDRDIEAQRLGDRSAPQQRDYSPDWVTSCVMSFHWARALWFPDYWILTGQEHFRFKCTGPTECSQLSNLPNMDIKKIAAKLYHFLLPSLHKRKCTLTPKGKTHMLSELRAAF